MRVIETKVYQFDELSDESKEAALDRFRDDPYLWAWHDEWIDSLNAFCELAGIEALRWDIVAGHVDVHFPSDNDVFELSSIRAWKWLKNNGWFDLAVENSDGSCTLTGYCGDCPLFDPITKLKDSPAMVPDLKQLFYECVQSWVFEARQDMEYCYSDESIIDLIEANEYEFTEEGKLV